MQLFPRATCWSAQLTDTSETARGQQTKLQPGQLQLRVARKQTAHIFPCKFLSRLMKICAHFTTHTSGPRKSVSCAISLATILHAPCRHGFLYYRRRTEKE
ncbi:unnamed protein product [Ixodes persulcatus]